jgi:peroxiredoxin
LRIKLAGCTVLLCLAATVLALTAFAQQSTAPTDPPEQQLLSEGKKALSSGKYDDAEKAFKKANKIEHDACLPCWVGIARAALGRGDLDSALKSADKGMSHASDDSSRAVIHDLRAEFFLAASSAGTKNSNSKLKDAEAESRVAIQLDPQYPRYHLRLGIVLYRESRDDEAKAEVQRFLELAPNGAESDFARSVLQNPRRARGTLAPEFDVVTASGSRLTLAGLSGKFVVLDFWATWCGPCRASVGDLKDLTRKYSRDQVELISISADSNRQQWSSFIAEKKMDWDQFLDEGGSMRELFGVHAFPTYIVIDRDGVIRERIVGEDPQQSVVYRLRQTLQAVVPEKGS